MQLRQDGKVGFPGGLVDPGEEACEGLMRELSEEMALDVVRPNKHKTNIYLETHKSRIISRKGN